MILKVANPRSEKARIRVLKQLQGMSLGEQKMLLKSMQATEKLKNTPKGKKIESVVKKVVHDVYGPRRRK